MTLTLDWQPETHPRWPKGTPKSGHIAAGEFMRIGDLLAKLSTQPSGTQDLTFLSRGAERIQSVIARRGDDPTRLNFDVHMRDGSSHEIGAGLSTDFGEVMRALQHLDRGGLPGGVEAPVSGAAISRRNRVQEVARQMAPETLRPEAAVSGAVHPGPATIATVHHADGSVTQTSHPDVASARQHLQRTHGLRPDQITTGRNAERARAAARQPGYAETARPEGSPATPGAKRKPRSSSLSQKPVVARVKQPAAAKQGFLDEHYREWRASLTPAEQKALRFYQSPGYDLVNGKLRGTGEGNARSDAATKALDSAIRKAPPLPAGTVLYRGVSADQFGKLTPGKVVTDPGFASTSLTRDGAGQFRERGKPLLMRITVPEGTRAAGGSVKEVILPRGSSFRYTGEKGGVANFELVPGSTRGVPGKSPGKPRYSEQIDKLLAQAEADKAINEWPVKPGPGAKGIIPQSVIDHPQRDTIGATVLMHTVEGPGGQRVFTPERQALHDRIVAQHLEGHKPQAKKMALFYAGGSASGKSTATKNIGSEFQEPPDAVHIDPDAIKALLPEYDALVKAGDRSPSSMTHEESSLLAKRIQAEAVKAKLNIVLDGTGDSSGGKFLDKVKAVAAEGYEPHVFMVDAPTDVAIARAYARGQKTGRFIAPSVIRDLHSKVIQSHNVWRNSPVVKSFQVWSTFDPADPDARKAIKLAEGGAGKTSVLNPKLYRQMLAKMSEQVAESIQ